MTAPTLQELRPTPRRSLVDLPREEMLPYPWLSQEKYRNIARR
jgi:hypothetical protein